jgi:uncharacterized membrane protein SpoIIM required for sporulation
MKETRFIAQNKEKWREAETVLNSPTKDPEKLGSLFIQVVDDLSYSRTYYPNRSVRVYLNKIARQYFSIISGHKKEKHNQFKLFWLDELPQIIYHSRKQLTISFLVFALAVAIGILSAYKDPQFTSTILGDDYVRMTQKNIESGDPMAVYKSTHELDMFLGITFNNLMVAFRTYALGIFLGIGTLGSLLQNGIMVGCFQSYFAQRNLFIESSLSIWLHGTLEISSIILAGGAGLILGKGLIFPGTYSRLQSLQVSGIRSLKLMLGITPVFVLAAIIESFLTRYTDAPAFLKLILILLSAIFIIGYFIIYPWYKVRTGFRIPLKEIRLSPTLDEPVNLGRIKNNADILKDTFHFYSRSSRSLLPWLFLPSAGMALVNTFVDPGQVSYVESDWWIGLFSDMFFALETPTPAFIVLNAAGLSLAVFGIISCVDREINPHSRSAMLKAFSSIFLLCLALFGTIYLGVLGILLAIVLFGYFLFVMYIQSHHDGNLGYGFDRGWTLFMKNNNQGASLQVMLMLLSFAFLLVLSAPILYTHLTILQWNFLTTDTWSLKIVRFFELFARIASFYLVLPLFAASFAYLYFSQDEVDSAETLKSAIAKMSTRTSRIPRR